MNIKIVVFLLISLLLPVKDDYSRYKGKTLGKLVDDLGNRIESRFYIDEPPFVLIGVEIKLKDSTRLSVYLKSLRYVEQQNLDQSWDWDKVKKERILRVE